MTAYIYVSLDGLWVTSQPPNNNNSKHTYTADYLSGTILIVLPKRLLFVGRKGQFWLSGPRPYILITLFHLANIPHHEIYYRRNAYFQIHDYIFKLYWKVCFSCFCNVLISWFIHSIQTFIKHPSVLVMETSP